MNRLMSAGLMRLFKNKTLYICIAAIFYTNFLSSIFDFIFSVAFEDGNIKKDPVQSMLSSGFLVLSILIPVFVCSLLGSEHSFGTIRNKVIIGNKRLTVYLSSFLLSLTGVLMIYAAVWLFTYLLWAIGYLDASALGTKKVLVILAYSLSASMALTAVSTLLALCVHSKSKSSVTALILSFVMMLVAVTTTMRLIEPEYNEVTEGGGSSENVAVELVKNPMYLGGKDRVKIQLLHDICPVSPMLDQGENSASRNAVFAFAETFVLIAGGLWIFKKRDLK